METDLNLNNILQFHPFWNIYRHFLEILANLSSQDVMIELADPTRAGLILPAVSDNKSEDVLMLLMPMMINA